MRMCEDRGRFLFEIRPDLIDECRLTEYERQLWILYYKERHDSQ